MDLVDIELAHRAKAGQYPFTVRQIEAVLNGLGYTLDRSKDCPHVARWQDGSGRTYPAISTHIKHIKTGLAACDVGAPRDGNFHKLQALRLAGDLFAVVQGAIFEV